MSVPKKVKVKVAQWCPTLCDSMDCTVGSLSLLQGIFPTQGSNPDLPYCRQILLSGPQGKPKNTGMDSLSLLQRICPAQKLKQGLLHCRQILYQLSYRKPKGAETMQTQPRNQLAATVTATGQEW